MKYSIPDVSLMINKKVKIIFTNKKYFIGILKSSDTFLNLFLIDVVNEKNEEFPSAVIRGQYVKNVFMHK